ncbi:MAG: TlpA family protein disulfide reductase [Terriglobales bacterium]
MTENRFRRRFITRIVGAMLVVGLSGCAASCATAKDSANQSSGSEQRFVSGDGKVTQYERGHRPKAPKVTGNLLDGSKFSSATLRGNVVVLNFWGSWCAPCRAEADHLVEVANTSRDSGVRFVGVNVRDAKDNATAFDRSHQVPYPSLYDPAGRIALAFRQTPPNTIPATIVIDRQGRTAAVFRKPVVLTELAPVVTKVAAES